MAIKIKQKEILKKYLLGGERKIMPWVKSQKYHNILFTREHDFANLNTYKELKNLE
jgi:molybdopterin-guanine dinucleotide biosynthesis protein A